MMEYSDTEEVEEFGLRRLNTHLTTSFVTVDSGVDSYPTTRQCSRAGSVIHVPNTRNRRNKNKCRRWCTQTFCNPLNYVLLCIVIGLAVYVGLQIGKKTSRDIPVYNRTQVIKQEDQYVAVGSFTHDPNALQDDGVLAWKSSGTPVIGLNASLVDSCLTVSFAGIYEVHVRITFKFKCSVPNYTASVKLEVCADGVFFRTTEAIWTDYLSSAIEGFSRSSVITKHVKLNALDQVCVVAQPIKCVLNNRHYNLLDISLHYVQENNTVLDYKPV